MSKTQVYDHERIEIVASKEIIEKQRSRVLHNSHMSTMEEAEISKLKELEFNSPAPKEKKA